MKAIDGVMPVYDNEIALPKSFAKLIGKKIGDTVKVTLNGQSLDYILTGLYSTTNNGGKCSALSEVGMRMLNPNYERRQVGIYLNEGEDIGSFIKKLGETFGVLNVYTESEIDKYAAAKKRAEEKISEYLNQYNIDSIEYSVIYNDEIILSGGSAVYQIEKITNMRNYVESQLGTYEGIASALTAVIGGISLLIIVIILSMTVKTIVIKRRTEFGILKAGGYTSKQLQFQLALSFSPFAVIGVIAGGILGALSFNPVIGAGFGAMGIVVTFTVDIVLAVTGAAVTLITAFAAATVAAGRIKNISVYELISE
jgi:putative ABC transport system permease protein